MADHHPRVQVAIDAMEAHTAAFIMRETNLRPTEENLALVAVRAIDNYDAEHRVPTADVEELLDALADCVNQSCGGENGELDSMALSAYRDALVLLARHGRVVIDQQVGRRVIAHWSAVDSQP